MADRPPMPPYPGTPRWLKMLGLAVLVIIAVEVAAHLAGLHHGHGHASGEEAQR